MRWSRYPLNTMKETPAEAEVASHRLMLRAGLIRRLAAGIYTWTTFGLLTLRKVEAIIREEMDRAGAFEVLMPAVQPAELWQESGRWQEYGPELLRFTDRGDREFVIGPTHEEVITDLVRRELQSYRQLPVNFYQIQTKFRDEIRPRFGVMRGREFIMKDAYSFHLDEASLREGYAAMREAYARMFTRMGLRFRAVRADSGAIGGTASEEFQVLADSGEDAIVFSDGDEYAANLEMAEALAPAAPRPAPAHALEKVLTPGKTRCEAVAEQLAIPLARTVKAIAVMHEGTFVLLVIRGDHSLNEIKAQKVQGLDPFRVATDAEIQSALGCKPGYIGPPLASSNLAKVRIVADRSVAAMADFVCGANEENYHVAGVNWGRDLPEPEVADLRNVLEGDPSPDGKGTLRIVRGIEVGHIFQLRTKYSTALKASVLDDKGVPVTMEMGCYGIGITRIVGAAIEQNHDDRGIAFPVPMAPFAVAVVPIGYKKSDAVRAAADRLYEQLSAQGIDVLLDDRDERPGVLFADSDLVGIPHRVVLSDKGLAAGQAEYKGRRDAAPQMVPADAIAAFVAARLAA